MKKGQVSIGLIAGGAITVTLGLFGFLFTQVTRIDAKADDNASKTASVSETVSDVRNSLVEVETNVKWLTAVISKQYNIPLPTTTGAGTATTP